MNVIDYVREEVTRQGHNVATRDGIERVGWMLDGWSFALQCCEAGATSFKKADIITLGKKIERGKNWRGLRKVGVRVGARICPAASEVDALLTRLLQRETDMTPLEFYKEFEEIHPFVDGNGRTGKILLNWKNGTLLDPIFPPADLFGHAILNP